jgi:hypothetical protein
MYQARFSLHMFMGVGIAAFLIACGQNNPSPLTGRAPGVGSPTTPPYTVASACWFARVNEFLPNQQDEYVTIDLDKSDHPTSIAYDSSGNLYVGSVSGRSSRVYEFPPGTNKKSRTIFHDGGFDNPIAMTADPDGNLYVANVPKFKKGYVDLYKPGRTSPDLKIDDVNYPSSVVFAKDHLWVADYNGNDVRAYAIDAKKKTWTLSWVIDKDMHGPSELSETGGNLYVRNDPLVGADYVREYGIGCCSAPVFARTIDARLHYIEAIATDKNGYVFMADSPFLYQEQYEISVYNGNGQLQYSLGKDSFASERVPSLVASPDRYYFSDGFSVRTFTGDKVSFNLHAGSCPTGYGPLAMMQP